MREKTKLIIFLLALISICVGIYIYRTHIVKNSVQNECTFEVEKKVERIKENISKYSFSSKNIFDRSSEGGDQTNYSFNGKTLLIKQTFFGETGKSEISYFLENNKVFFFEKKNTEYVLPISQDISAKTKNVDIKDFYLDGNQKLCSWFLNKKLQNNDEDTKSLVGYFISGL